MPSPSRDPIPRLPPPNVASAPSNRPQARQDPSSLHSSPVSSTGAGAGAGFQGNGSAGSGSLSASASGTGGRGSPHRTLRKLASAHNLGYAAAASLNPPRGSATSNPPSLLAQQRLQQQQQQHQPHHHHHHHHPSPPRLVPQHRRTFSPTRRNASCAALSPLRSSTQATASSEAPIVQQLTAAAAAMSSTALRTSGALNGRTAYDHVPLEKLIRDGPPDGDYDKALECARLKVLQQEIKSDSDGMSNLRIYVWLIMLDAPVLRTDDYLSLIHRGASPAYSKIRNDTFRTLTTDPLFRRRVSEASLIRLLNAIAWKLHDNRPNQGAAVRQSLPASQQETPKTNTTSTTDTAPHNHHHHQPPQNTSPAAKSRARALTLTTEGSESGMASEAGIYVQGMNVLAAPFLYAARSESEAFVAFHQLLTRECPGYIRGAMDGVHNGLALVDKVLGIVDPKLSLYLTSKGLSAELYAFPSVLTLCACTPPLPEVLRLWDFLFAYGPHLNIVCIAAQLVIHRDEIMASQNPSHFLRTFPALNAEKVQAMTLALLAKLPDDVYSEITSHAM